MAVRADSSTDRLSRTANLPSSTAYTVAGWIRIRGTGDGSWEHIFGLLASGASAWHVLYNKVAGGSNVFIHGNNGNTNLSVALATDTWYYAAVGCNGTGSSSLTGWIITSTGTVYTASTWGTSFTPAELSLLSSVGFGEWTNMAAAHVMVWDTKLTTAELQHQMYVAQPVIQRASLRAWWPLWSTSDIADYSGNGYGLTSNGTPATEDGPPVSYGAPVWVAPWVATGGGGTTYNQSAAGTLTTAGATVRQANKVLAGTLTSAGALVRSIAKVVGGTLTTAGALAKRAAKTMSGTLTTAGALVTSRLYSQVVAGTLTTAGALTRRTSKSLAGTLTTAGALVRRAAKSLAGTLTTAGALATSFISGSATFSQVVGGTLTTAGALTRQTSKSLAGTLATAGAITKRIAKRLTGTLTTAGSLLRELFSPSTAKVDVTLTDARVYTCTLTDARVYTCTAVDALTYTVTLGDRTT